MQAGLTPRKRFTQTNDVFYAIADPTRRQLLDRLREGHACVKHLASPFGMSRPAVSQHLRILLDAKLIEVEAVGRERRYKLCPEQLQLAYDWIAHYQEFWPLKLAGLRKFLDKTK
jgi:DNA-binding transcriptional ArsR family regulator